MNPFLSQMNPVICVFSHELWNKKQSRLLSFRCQQVSREKVGETESPIHPLVTESKLDGVLFEQAAGGEGHLECQTSRWPPAPLGGRWGIAPGPTGKDCGWRAVRGPGFSPPLVQARSCEAHSCPVPPSSPPLFPFIKTPCSWMLILTFHVISVGIYILFRLKHPFSGYSEQIPNLFLPLLIMCLRR